MRFIPNFLREKKKKVGSNFAEIENGNRLNFKMGMDGSYIALLYPCSTWASIYTVLYMNKLQMKYLTSCSMQKLRQ